MGRCAFKHCIKKARSIKGAIWSGKTKLAESVSHFFNQPIQSVNCSVDLDAESLLGFKTIVQKDRCYSY